MQDKCCTRPFDECFCECQRARKICKVLLITSLSLILTPSDGEIPTQELRHLVFVVTHEAVSLNAALRSGDLTESYLGMWSQKQYQNVVGFSYETFLK